MVNDLVVEATDLHKEFQRDAFQVVALQDVHLTIQRGEFVAFMGPSGSGKSTLLYLIAAIDRPTRGRVKVLGRDILQLKERAIADWRNENIGFIFQTFNLIGDLTVFDNVELPLTYRGIPTKERRQRVRTVLERVGMADREIHFPSQLSGGQQQRVAVARAMVGEPLILLADEPTGNLDSGNGRAVMELLGELHAQGATICMVTHDPRYAHLADRTVRLFDGRIVSEGQGPGVPRLDERGFEVAG